MDMYQTHTFWVVGLDGATHPTPISYDELNTLVQGGYSGPVMSTRDSAWKTAAEYGVANCPPPPPPPQVEASTAPPPSGGVVGAAPYKSGYAVIDTETGGFDPRVNPLLSIALLAVSPQGTEIDGVALQVRPDPGTVLEVPIPAHMGSDTWKPRIEFCWDVFTGERLPPNATQTRPFITPKAAEINGFVRLDGRGCWDFEPAVSWMQNALAREDVDRALCRFLHGVFQSAPLAVAHNASFDRKFVCRCLPETYANLACRPIPSKSGNPQWECTMQRLRRYRKHMNLGTGKGAATLETLAKFACYSNDNPHDALADAKACRAGLFWLLEEMGRLGIEAE